MENKKQMKDHCIEKNFISYVLIFIFLVVCFFQISISSIKVKKLSEPLPKTGDASGLEFTVDSSVSDETGTIIQGTCYYPSMAEEYYNYGMDQFFLGVYAKPSVILFHNGDAIELPTQLDKSITLEQDGIHGVGSYIAFVPLQYEKDLENRDIAVFWKGKNREEIFWLKDQ